VPFTIVGLGKLGGAEITYGSDLDIVFVAEDKTRDLPRLQKLAVELMDLLSARTEQGTAFTIDSRLRPDGEKGLLVNTLRAHEDYYRQRAQLWEVQALSRARPVAGNATLGKAFEEMAAVLTNFKEPGLPLAALKLGWKQEIARMRLRVEKERTPAGKEGLAFKTGAGGLMDAEFIAQTLCLEGGWHEPNTLRALERARREKVLPLKEADLLIESYRQLRRIESILRRWSYEGETELPDDSPAQYRVAVRCGFEAADELLRAVAFHREDVRRVYAGVLGTG
jgi:glutamate-ammonia-ligase adenylyltransferase